MSSTQNVNDWAVCRQKRVSTLNLSKNSRACLPSARIPSDDGYLLVKQIIQKISLVFVRIRRVNPPFQETTIPWWCRYKPQPCTAEVEATPLYWSILVTCPWDPWSDKDLATMVPCTPPWDPAGSRCSKCNKVESGAAADCIRESVSISNEESEGKTNSKKKNADFPGVIPGFHAGHRGKPVWWQRPLQALVWRLRASRSLIHLNGCCWWFAQKVVGWPFQNHAGLIIFWWIYLILWPFLVLQTNPCSSRIIFYECILYRLYSMHENMPWVLSDI